MRFPLLTSPEDIIALVQELGFLPFFAGPIPEFSIEELCPPELWFSAERDGPWEWKGPIIRQGSCVYGKFYGGRAGYVSLDWLGDFCNHRRDGYDFEGWYEDGYAPRKHKLLYDCIEEHGRIHTKALKRACDFTRDGNKGFDTAITRLQMQTFVTIADFTYMQDKFGKPYGWGVAVYATPEHLYGEEALEAVGGRTPAQSRARMAGWLQNLFPNESEKTLGHIIG